MTRSGLAARARSRNSSAAAKDAISPGGVPGAGTGSGHDRQLHLAGHRERLPARRDDLHAGALAQDGLGQGGDRLDEVLAVVKQQKRVAPAQVSDEHVAGPVGRGAAFDVDGERVGDRVREQVVFGDCGEAHEHGTIAEPARRCAGGFYAQGRLPGPSRAGQGHQPGAAQQLHGPLKFRAASHERGGPQRQVPPRRASLVTRDGRRGRRWGDDRVLVQDLLHDGAQVPRRVDAELVGEDAPGPAEYL
jgi:hypothetical protein